MSNPKCNLTPAEQEAALAVAIPMTAVRLERARAHFEQYIFYDTWGRRDFREYFCPQCGRFELERSYSRDAFKEHHGAVVDCPRCGAPGVLICLGRVGKFGKLHGWQKQCFMQAAEGRLHIVAGWSEIEYSYDDLRPLPAFYPKARYVVEPGKRQMWRYEYRDGKWEYWPMENFCEPFARTFMGYATGYIDIIGAEEIEKTSMRYCGLIDYVDNVWDIDLLERDGEWAPAVWGVIRYLGEYSRHPQIEMLEKLGHEDVIARLMDHGSLPRGLVNWRATSPPAFFRLTKLEYKLWRAAGGSIGTLEDFRRDGHGLAFGDYMRLTAYFGHRLQNLMAAVKADGTDIKKVERYITAQAPEGASGVETAGLWLDYLDMAARLDRELTFRRNLFPAHLREEHDAAAALLQTVTATENKKAYARRYRALKRKYAYTDGTLSVVVPVSAEEIVREGQILRHCVGGYAERHVQGKTTILFLRWADDAQTPYMTVEINDATNGIRQVHGYKNECFHGSVRPRETHGDFLEEWTVWLRHGSPRSRNGRPVRPRKTEDKTA